MTQTREFSSHGLLDNNVNILNPIKLKRKDIAMTKSDLKELHNKVVEITMKDGSFIEGIVRETIMDKEIVVAKDGNWEDREFVSLDLIKNLNSSDYPYYSLSYKTRLREQKKPRFEFRFSKEELAELVGKYVLVNYDGKIIDGKIVDCKHSSHGSNEITVESETKEIKTIHDYRLRDLEVTGSNYAESEGFKRIRSLEQELFVILEADYNEGCSEGPESKAVEPDTLLENYFECKLKVLRKEETDFSECDYNWIEEIVEQHDSYKKGSKVDKAFYEDVKKARDLNAYYESRKEFVDEAFHKASEVDWSTYSRSQIDGEIEALEYIYDSGLINR